MTTAVLLGLAGAAVVVLGILWWKARDQVHRHREAWNLVTQGCPDVLWHWNARSKTFTASQRVWDWADRPPGGIQELFDHLHDYVVPEDLPEVRHQMGLFKTGTTSVLDIEFRLRFPQRSERWFRVRGLRAGDKNSDDMAGSWSDVTEAKALGLRLWQWAHFDPLTGLANHLHLVELLEDFPRPHSLLLVDIDHFSSVNAAYKREGGDRMLQWLAQTLKALFRADDVVARWGGDEFVLVVHGSLELAESLANRIHQTLDHPVPMFPNPWNLSVSIGIVPCPEDHYDTPSLLAWAEYALHEAQRSGGNQSVVFNEAIGAEAERRSRLERNLTRAVQDRQLTLVFQPQFRLKDHRLMGFEALTRWTDGDLGPISPTEFIPMVEELGLISALGAWVLEEACRFLAQHRTPSRQPLTMSVNVSVQQLRDPHFVDRVKQIVDEAGLPASSVELEITESVLIDSMDDMVEKLVALRNSGFRIALDDFGKGYSSLSYLKLIPLDSLKIDRDFVADESQESLVEAIVRLGQKLGLQVIAEGVELESQLRVLRSTGCHKVQGYLFSRPLTDTDATRLLAQHFAPE